MGTKNHLTEVFRFVSVRQPKLPEAIDPGACVIDYDSVHDSIGSGAISDMETANGQLLHTQMVGAVTMGAMRADLVELAVDFRSSAHFIADRGVLYSKVAGLDLVHRYLNNNASAASVDDALAAVEATLGQTVENVVTGAGFPELQMRLWDNLIAQAAAPADPALREDIIKVLRVLRVLEVLNGAAPSDDPLKAHIDWRTMRTVLPRQVFPMPEEAVPDVADPAPVPSRPDNTALFAFSRRVDDALTDLDDILERQSAVIRSETAQAQPAITSGKQDRPALKRTAPAARQQEPWKLRDVFVQQLATDTRDLLTEHGIALTDLDVPAAQKKLKEVAGKRWTREYQRAKAPLTAVLNGLVLTLDWLCGAKMEEDPCGSYEGGMLPQTRGNVQNILVGDLLITRRQLIRYQPGEVAHIENVLEGEERDREHTHTRRLEDRSTTDTERTTFEERDLQTTDRFSLEQASSSVISQQSQMNVGASLTASYGGMVTVGATFGYATSNSQTNAAQSASSFAQEVTSRALKRVSERVREERTTIRIEETVEYNSHKFLNPAGGGNISGVYTWVDKLYLARLMNYGKRMMMELHIPEPAAFYLYAMARAQQGEFDPPVPLAEAGIHSFNDITESNYAALGAQYDVADLDPPPHLFTYVNKAFNLEGQTEGARTSADNTMEVPEGYRADYVMLKMDRQPWENFVAVVGTFHIVNSLNAWWAMDPLQGVLPVSFLKTDNVSCIVNIVLKCVRMDRTYDEWRIKTYNAIVQAYRAKLSDYENKVTSATFGQAEFVGDNPGINQAIVREELKRSALETITGQRFEAFSAMRNNHNPFGYPQFLFHKAEQEGRYASFFEKAIEWDNMTWELYPYFYGRKLGWMDKMRMLGDQADPDFTHFLRAGMAKVLVPVTPTMTASMLHFLETGNVWAGEDVPLASERSLRVMEDLGDIEALELDPQRVGDPWVIKMPTSLVALPIGFEEDNVTLKYNLPDYVGRFVNGELDGVDLNA